MELAKWQAGSDIASLLGEVKREIDISRRRRVFCNRNLRMASIELIGFDMDYTLAVYRQERMEALSVELTIRKLIENLGYPEEIRGLEYDSTWAIPGLVVDRQLGNVFKMDRHGHVDRVHHGRRLLTKEERHQQYRNVRIKLSLPRYTWIDTLFALPEAVIYVALVDYFEQRGGGPDHERLYQDIRASIDEAHRDDTLKAVIKADLPGYLFKDVDLAETLHKLRSSGKKLFLLTNSLWDYTSAVMSYLLDGERRAYPSWRNYFDVVIVGANKPAFFADRNPFLQIDPLTGQPSGAPVKQLSRDRVYQAGNIADFEDMTGVRGDRVLYVGDHIYGDILRLKKVHVWRTAMIIQELDREIAISERLEDQIRDLQLLDRRRRNLESELDFQVLILKRVQKGLDQLGAGDASPLRERLEEARRQAKTTLDSLRSRGRTITEEVEALERSIDRAYNPYWGAIMREGNETSRFGAQVDDFADLYTSRVSNFLSYSPLRYFRAARQPMPHEL